jgi:hypothetical protein
VTTYSLTQCCECTWIQCNFKYKLVAFTNYLQENWIYITKFNLTYNISSWIMFGSSQNWRNGDGIYNIWLVCNSICNVLNTASEIWKRFQMLKGKDLCYNNKNM